MNDKDIDLRSVNWERGMLLTPEHFLRQERYVDSLFSWMLRYAADSYGLVGGGPRIEPAERGAVSHDPVVDIFDDGETVKVSVTQCRGISPSGDIIEVDPSHPLDQPFSKKELESQEAVGVYVVADPQARAADDGEEDAANPQLKSSRWRKYQLRLGVTGAEATRAVQIARLRRGASLRFEKVGDFIPVCTTLVGHSKLRGAWENLKEQVTNLADRYAQLHKAIVEYIVLAEEKGFNTRGDDEALQFVGRMVVTLESCLHEVANPVQPPQRFFQQMYRAIRGATLYLDLSAPARKYFRELAEAGETEFSSLIEQEQQAAIINRELTIHDNLTHDVQQVEESLFRLRRLEEALEGKYWDFRLSTSLQALNFFFDRSYNPPALFESSAKPSHSQVYNNELTFVFAPRNLKERQRYRLVLVGRSETPLRAGTEMTVEIRINAGAGQAIKPVYETVVCELPRQRNFAVDFIAPENIQTITDLRVVVNASLPVESCLLYVRSHLQRVVTQAFEVTDKPRVDVRPLDRRERPASLDAHDPRDPRERPEVRERPAPSEPRERPVPSDTRDALEKLKRRVQPVEDQPQNYRRRRLEPIDGDDDKN